ncbi:MAG: TRAM domain-containing protein, partial [Acidobacteria bacterium]|nr:TRAM domain-containing protein [Acidobacteriota bacterium]
LDAGQKVELTIEKPAAGGRMIARHQGRVVLVRDAIPGERVLARIERVERRLAFAVAIGILESSSDRRASSGDPACGGSLYAHIHYPRQLTLKAQMVADAFFRMGRIPLPDEVAVAGSPELGYRMRARLHVREGRAGFYREGTHELCDPDTTGQLRRDSVAAVQQALASLADEGVAVASVELSENLESDQRALHFDVVPGASMSQTALDTASSSPGASGCTARTIDGERLTSGLPVVSDLLSALTEGRVPNGELSRHPESFFQANRFLLPRLVTAVLDAVPRAGNVLDLYAGVGLFSVALAATGLAAITAVEGDRAGAADLESNARPFGGAIRVSRGRVEDYVLARRSFRADTILVDPPRTGISREAIDALARHGASRIVYVSCDPPTMARDARRLLDAGYRLGPLQCFDLFPNTPHVETLGVFDLQSHQ